MKRFTTLILLVVLAFYLFACGEEQKAEKYCWNCGEGVTKEASFCEHCGTKLNETQSRIESSDVDEIERSSSAESSDDISKAEGSQPSEPSNEQSVESESSSSLFYSSNDYETAKNGNTGVFSYKNKSGSYDIYWIIDFDEGYVYFFTDGNGENTCDKVELSSGDLNDKITATWYDSGDQWSWYLHFKYINHPETLVVNDHLGIVTEFTTTDLEDALSIRDSKRILTYEKPSTPSENQQTSSESNQETAKSEEKLARQAAYQYRDDNKDTILSAFSIYEYLIDLGYDEEICAKLCFEEKLEGIYDGSAMYDYERILMFHDWGYSRQAIIDYYEGAGRFSYEKIEYLVDECLTGRKLTYEYIDDELQLVDKDNIEENPSYPSAIGSYSRIDYDNMTEYVLTIYSDGTLYLSYNGEYMDIEGNWTQTEDVICYNVWNIDGFEWNNPFESTVYEDGMDFLGDYYTRQ